MTSHPCPRAESYCVCVVNLGLDAGIMHHTTGIFKYGKCRPFMYEVMSEIINLPVKVSLSLSTFHVPVLGDVHAANNSMCL